MCESGDPVALYELAYRYRVGEGVEKNLDKAKELYERVLLKQKHLRALFWLGKINNELAEDLNKEEGRLYYEIGSALGDGACTEMLADVYRFGDGVDYDDDKAIELYTKAIEQGDEEAYLCRGEMYLGEEGTLKQGLQDLYSAYNGEVSEFTKSFAAYRIGEVYHEGLGVEEDNNKAKMYLQEAADNGISDACGMLGFIFGMGLAGEKDIDKAFEYFDMMGEEEEAQIHNLKGRVYLADNREEEAISELNKAVELGSDAAGELLEAINKKKNQIDYRTASIQDLITAHEKGDKKVTYVIAMTYRRGERGVKRDINTALKYYQEVIDYDSVEFGTGHAYSDLARIYLNGENGKKDYGKALEFAQKSLNYIKLGSSYLTISQIYDEGLGVQADYEKAKEVAREGIRETDDGNAYAWYARLLCRGNVEGEKARELEDCLEKCLERTPRNSFANHIVGQFYMTGVGKKYKKDLVKVIECFEIAGEPDDYCKIGDIYSKDDNGMTDYRKVIEYYKKAWDMGDLFAAAGIAGLELADEFADAYWVDGRLGVDVGKDYLFRGKDNNLRIMCLLFVIKYLKRVYQSDKAYFAQQCRQICDNMGRLDLKMESDEQADILAFSMANVIDGAALATESTEEVISILQSVERIMEHNQAMDYACREAVGRNYYDIGRFFLNNNMDLSAAKQYLEKSGEYGCEEGQRMGKRIKKNLFGKLVFK